MDDQNSFFFFLSNINFPSRRLQVFLLVFQLHFLKHFPFPFCDHQSHCEIQYTVYYSLLLHIQRHRRRESFSLPKKPKQEKEGKRSSYRTDNHVSFSSIFSSFRGKRRKPSQPRERASRIISTPTHRRRSWSIARSLTGLPAPIRSPVVLVVEL